eukprot:7308381-Lingulodinium_polyedra.AAC.1
MVRCGLALPIGANSALAGLSAGAFAVKKDAAKDRLIGDRRPRNALEAMPGPVRLPYAPRLRKLRLPPHKAVWVAKRDLSNCFYLFEVEPERLERQVIGPRIPRSWLEEIGTEELDWQADFASWCSEDLLLPAAASGPELDDREFCQLAMRGVMMGDVGAVT